MTHPVVSQPDKEDLYGRYQAGEDVEIEDRKQSHAWRRDLSKKVAYKSLDIPISDKPDDMQIDARKRIVNNKQALSPLSAALLSAGLLGAAYIFAGPFAPAVAPVAGQVVERITEKVIEKGERVSVGPVTVKED